MKLQLSVKPKYLVLISVTLSIILFIITVLDIVEGKKDIYKAKSDEAVSLLSAVQKAGENVYTSNMEVENLITEQLINTAFFISKMEAAEKLTKDKLNQISISTETEQICIYSKTGKMVLSSSNSAAFGLDLSGLFKGEIDSLNKGYYDYFVPGVVRDTSGKQHFLIIQKRDIPEGGYFALSISSERLLEFRKRIGIGKLFQKIADADEIIYLVIQDEKGIITASSSVEGLSSFSGDSFLTSSLLKKSIASREVEFKGEKIFETIKPFTVENEAMGIIRIGLSLEPVNKLFSRIIIRSIAISFLLLLTGIIVLTLITSKQNFSLLNDEYKRIQTYTGGILSNMSDGVIAADGTGKIDLINSAAEKIFDLKPNASVGKNIDDIINNPSLPLKEIYISDKSSYYWEHTLTTKDNKQIISGWNVSVIRNENYSINTIVSVIRDLTAQRALEEVQKRNEKLTAMGELAAGVAHEIKNPLNSIGITTQRFEKEFIPESDKEEYLTLIRTMKSEIKRVNEIINQFLKFAKPPKIQLTKINSKELLKEVYNSFQSRAARDKIDFTLSAIEVDIYADFSQLKQAIINIVLNAFEALPNAGAIAIDSIKENNHLSINISDNGEGISEKDMDKIFNLYYTTKPSGTGLGLSIVNQIITEHNGALEVKSKLRQGTTVKIKLPVS